MDTLTSDPARKGKGQRGSGAPRKTSTRQNKQLVGAIEKYRGKFKATVVWLKKRYFWARIMSNFALESRLDDAGLAYLAETTYIPERLSYCVSVKRKHQATSDKWAHRDGSVFYLDRTVDESVHTKKAALGCMVWRIVDGTDALYADCAGLSTYTKAQGKPVKVWGMLAHGKLNIEMLEERDVMNNDLYATLIEENSLKG